MNPYFVKYLRSHDIYCKALPLHLFPFSLINHLYIHRSQEIECIKDLRKASPTPFLCYLEEGQVGRLCAFLGFRRRARVGQELE